MTMSVENSYKTKVWFFRQMVLKWTASNRKLLCLVYSSPPDPGHSLTTFLSLQICISQAQHSTGHFSWDIHIWSNQPVYRSQGVGAPVWTAAHWTGGLDSFLCRPQSYVWFSICMVAAVFSLFYFIFVASKAMRNLWSFHCVSMVNVNHLSWTCQTIPAE